MLRSMQLINFKAFDDQTIEIRPLTLLTGLNGMGKSSIFQALLLLRQSKRISYLTLNGEHVELGTWEDVLFEKAKEDFLSIVLNDDHIYLDTHPDGERIYTEDTIEFRYLFDGENDRVILSTPVDENLDPEYAEYRNSEHYSRFMGSCKLFDTDFIYLAAERLGPRKLSEITMTTDVGKYGEYAVHQLHRLRDQTVLNKLRHPGAKSDTLLDNVEAWLGEISPGVRIRLDYFRNIDAIQSLFAFEIGRDVSNYYRATNVGFGITYALPILVGILSAPRQALVLLENPEAHLHPRGQARLGELLSLAAEAGIQLIVETHSDHILNGVRVAVKNHDISPENVLIHYFAREEGHRTFYSIPIGEDGSIERWPAGFFDEYENLLMKLL